MKREFLMLAHSYKDQDILGHWISTKLDGHRMFWDGGISRGLPTHSIPWANTAKDKKEIIATGLWSRGAKAIQAPDWFLDQLPLVPLDGEAWAGIGNFQEVAKIIRRDVPTDAWEQIDFRVFDSPSYDRVFHDGFIDSTSVTLKDTLHFALNSAREKGVMIFKTQPSLDLVYKKLSTLPQTVWSLHEQEKIPYKDHEVFLDTYIKKALDEGHEGVMVRDPMVGWRPERSHSLLKIKPFEDAEAEVIGFTFGKGKFLGMMGALIVKKEGKIFRVSGFTDLERTLDPTDYYYATENAGDEAPSNMEVPAFKKGTIITYKYRELTDDGIPKEARYLRQR